MTSHSSVLPQADVTYQGITCIKCREPVENYDPGSLRYQEFYGHPLPVICDSCLNLIFNKMRGFNDNK